MTENVVAIAERRNSELQHRQMYIDGNWVDAISGEVFETINHTTGRLGPLRHSRDRPT